jgi:hypothetical protein
MLPTDRVGGVRKWVTADLAQAIVGWCTQPGGVGGPGAALARISV